MKDRKRTDTQRPVVRQKKGQPFTSLVSQRKGERYSEDKKKNQKK